MMGEGLRQVVGGDGVVVVSSVYVRLMDSKANTNIQGSISHLHALGN